MKLDLSPVRPSRAVGRLVACFRRLLSGVGRRRESGQREGQCRSACRSNIEGVERVRRSGIRLGLFAALSVSLSIFAYLHLCQLDVPQNIGVCRTGRTRCNKCQWHVTKQSKSN